MRYLTILAWFVMVLTSHAANAGTQVLGSQIGVTTSEQLRSGLPKKTSMLNRGINRYSGGQMFLTSGAPYEVEGLSEVLYIFDRQDKLAGVIMDMDKARFAAVYEFLSQKYRLSAERRPFVGNQYARFLSTDTTIELDAPHLSFTMQARYIRNDLLQKFNADSAQEDAAKKKSEAEKF